MSCGLHEARRSSDGAPRETRSRCGADAGVGSSGAQLSQLFERVGQDPAQALCVTGAVLPDYVLQNIDVEGLADDRRYRKCLAALDDVILRADQNGGNTCQSRVLQLRSAELLAVHDGHYEVEEHHTRPRLPQLLEAFSTVGSRHDGQAIEHEAGGDELTGRRVVFNDENRPHSKERCIPRTSESIPERWRQGIAEHRPRCRRCTVLKMPASMTARYGN